MSSPPASQGALRLLVLAPNWLGDVVMHTPLLSRLDAARETVRAATGRELHLTVAVRDAWAGLFAGDHRVDEILELERGGRSGGVWGARRLADSFRAGRFAAVLICPPSLRTALVSWLARIETRIGYRSDGRSLLLTHGLDRLERGSLHYSLEMVALGEAWLRTLGVPENADAGFSHATSLPGCRSIRPAVGFKEQPFWVVAPGTTYGEAKTWPLDRVAEFVLAARAAQGVRIVFLGDAAARGFTQRLKDRLDLAWGDGPGSGADLVDLTGRTDLVEAVAVLKAAAAFVGNDSGLMHLAAALGLPTVGVFGSSNPDWTAPVGSATAAVIPDGFSCRPCYLKKCNQPRFCLETVEAAAVLEKVRGLSVGQGSPGKGR